MKQAQRRLRTSMNHDVQSNVLWSDKNLFSPLMVLMTPNGHSDKCEARRCMEAEHVGLVAKELIATVSSASASRCRWTNMSAVWAARQDFSTRLGQPALGTCIESRPFLSDCVKSGRSRMLIGRVTLGRS